MANIWALISLINKIWDALILFFGYVKKEKHDATQKEIKEKTDKVTPETPEKERLDAIKELEDRVNNRT